jgi:hypothetical protein
MLWHLIKERGLAFDLWDGVSIGAFNTLYMAQNGPQSQETLVDGLRDIWLGLGGRRDVFLPWYDKFLGIPVPEWLNFLLVALTDKPSLYHLGPTKELLAKHVKPEWIEASSTINLAGITDLLTRQYVELESSGMTGKQYIKTVIASGSIPVIFPPVKVAGDYYAVDGGVREGTPLAGTIKQMVMHWPDAKYEIYVGVHSSRASKLQESAQTQSEFAGITLRGIFKVAEQAIDAQTREVHENDIKHVLEINSMLAQGCSLPGYKHVDIYLVAPVQSLGTGLGFDPAQMVMNFNHGKERARTITQPLQTL